ncbi:uncharacterized protein [Oryza sativa Japonica Group]|uniref:uncharacterized protein isoform X2 n=1 Tax=Oryza sativa subsp. japonica TaxID=39947 RepID=UPI0007754C91|nr:uncharacterized protein LOC4349257 isoform X2 [Oryza sativa Japonica Group]KAF2914614.1 hypothetical protein DAI22_10g176800 [Oryza sativa Japonica Group]
MAEDANAGRKSSTHLAQSPELHASLESHELDREIPKDASVHQQAIDEPQPLYNIPITRGEGTLITELRKVMEELRVSYYADTDEETREQLKQFWDDEFNAISSGETTIERDLKWMRKEVIEAFETYSEANVVDYELEDLSRQCLIFDDCGQPYHHYNFTMKSKRPDSDLESSTNCPDSDLESSTNLESCISRHYFAEVKLMDGKKHYFCCPLESFDNGHCHGCRNSGIDLKHPSNGGYEEGNAYSGLSFDDDEFDAISEETTKEKGIEWMREEVIEAFETYSNANVVDYELEDLSRQCLIFDDCGQPYHHYNFTMKSKCPNSDLESSTNVESCISRHYFAEVKLMDGEKHYFCCPLESFDNGHCHGCRNSGIDLKHPSNGGYEEGNADSGFSFDPI